MNREEITEEVIKIINQLNIIIEESLKVIDEASDIQTRFNNILVAKYSKKENKNDN